MAQRTTTTLAIGDSGISRIGASVRNVDDATRVAIFRGKSNLEISCEIVREISDEYSGC